jgi:hypothetical protein
MGPDIRTEPEPVDAAPLPRVVQRTCGRCGGITRGTVVRFCESCRQALDDDVVGAS